LVHAVVCAGKHRKTALYIQPITGRGEAAVLARDIEGYCIPFFVRGELIALTDFAAPNFRIIRIDTNNPATCNWKDIVPESNFRIQRFAVAGDRIFVTRVHRFSTHIEVFGTDGVRWEDPIPPFLGSVELLRRTNESQHLFFSSTSICQVPTTHCLDTSTNKMVDWFVAGIPFDPSNIIVEEVTYQSKDGMQVPMLLAVRKDLHGSGPLPTFITGYGGFGACVTPRFTAFSTFLLEQGLLIAVPGVRGGSELGEEWHRAGMRENRQTSFDDFIASVEWLVAQGRAAPGRICIGGGSNAGLLVGAVVTQRPELFSAVVCLGPLLDMLRYQLFDHARGWSDEYGCADDEEDFRFLMAYSPYHHIQPNVPYPAVLFISGDADNRCNPMHARKMTARMQGATSSERPILLDYRANWGHTPVQPLSVKVDALTDRLAFVCDQLGINVACERT
jgi:prolyl oligopeptidase